MERIGFKKAFAFVLAGLLLFNLCFMLYWCEQKQGWFVDEGLSFEHSNVLTKYVPRTKEFAVLPDFVYQQHKLARTKFPALSLWS